MQNQKFNNRQVIITCLFLFLFLPFVSSAQEKESSCVCNGKLDKQSGSSQLSGTVSYGTPNSGIKGLNLCLLQNGMIVAKGKTGKKGKYRFSKIPNGTYEIVVCDGNGVIGTAVAGVKVQSAQNDFFNVFLPTPGKN